jgi:hypothetical protein
VDSFFQERDQKLLQKLRDRLKAEAEKETLSAASGITDEAVLDQLISLGIGPETLAALSLVPLAEVAWADGAIHAKERSAILLAAEEAGLDKGTEGHQLLEAWLEQQPDQNLLAAWRSYVSAISKTLDSEAKKRLKDALVGRARSVAEAAGGFLSSGLGKKVSSAEQAMLAELEQAFSEGD